MIDLTILGISLQNEGQTPVLLLYPDGTDLIFTLLIGPMEAFAISSGLNMLEAYGPVSPQGLASELPQTEAALPLRPMTHDLLLSVMHSLGGVLAAVEILGVEKGVYMAEAVISTPAGTVRIDCRPSDGVALAVRCGAVLRVKESVLPYADSMEKVLENLPGYLRTIVQANLPTFTPSKKKITFSLTVNPNLNQIVVKGSEQAENRATRKPGGVGEESAPVEISRENPEPRVISGAVVDTALSPMSIMSSLGENATEEERWAELLRQISPENKEIM